MRLPDGVSPAAARLFELESSLARFEIARGGELDRVVLATPMRRLEGTLTRHRALEEARYPALRTLAWSDGRVVTVRVVADTDERVVLRVESGTYAGAELELVAE